MKKPNFISYIDDPRINFQMALEFEKIEDEFWEEGENEFLEEQLKLINSQNDDNILFPVKDIYELRDRLREMLCYKNGLGYEFFNHNLFLRAVFKSSLHLISNRICFKTDSFGDYGNPELQMVLKMMKNLTRTDAKSFFEGVIFYSPTDLEVGQMEDLEKRMASFISGAIWTQTNIGRSVYDNAKSESQDIMEEVTLKNTNGLIIQRLQKSYKYVEVEVVNENQFKTSQDKKISGLFKVDNDNVEKVKTQPYSIKLETSNPDITAFKLEKASLLHERLKQADLFNLKVGTLEHAKLLSNEVMIIQINNVKYKLSFKKSIKIDVEV